MVHAVPQLKGCPRVEPTPLAARGKLAKCRAISSRWANRLAVPHPENIYQPSVSAALERVTYSTDRYAAKQAENNSRLEKETLHDT